MQRLNTKRFDTSNCEWVDFIILNRLSSHHEHSYDIVVGPTANDNTNMIIDLFINGIYGDPKSDFAFNTFLQLILPQKLPHRYILDLISQLVI